MRLIPFTAVSAMLLLLAGCATSPDPAQGGFISGVNGLMSGGYDQRVAAQSMELDRMRAQQAAAQATANQAQVTLAARERSLDTLRGDVARLERSLRDAQAKAARQRAQNASLSDRDRQLMTDLDRSKARLAGLQEQLRANPTPQEYDAVQKEYLDLRTTVTALNQELNEVPR
jgi:chromosome segregation ATPase